jgi:tRNA-splicing ligase RtcB
MITKTSNIFGKHDENTIKQFREVEEKAVRAALMADGHLGYVMPIGGVAAYDNQVSVVGVGFDIACGNAAIRTDASIQDFSSGDLNRIADEIQSSISFGVGRTNKANDAPIDHPLFQSDDWKRVRELAGEGGAYKLFEKAQEQLGTVGSGNHYVDVFHDEDGRIWVGVHFGSRGLGHNIASGFLSMAQGKAWGERVPESEVILDLNTPFGDHYWALMNLAGEYAYAGREWVARKVVEILRAKEVELVHNHHNFAWKEEHDVPVTKGESFGVRLMNYEPNRELVVVRKGATPAFPGQKGFVGGSMGDNAVILEGTDTGSDPLTPNDLYDVEVQQRDALYSTVHGAGRVMSRTQAKGKTNRKTGELKLNADGTPVKAGQVTSEMMQEWIAREGVIVRGGDVDESPHCYRRLPEVLNAQGDTIKVLHTLTPKIVVMAGNDVKDPYAD